MQQIPRLGRHQIEAKHLQEGEDGHDELFRDGVGERSNVDLETTTTDNSEMVPDDTDFLVTEPLLITGVMSTSNIFGEVELILVLLFLQIGLRGTGLSCSCAMEGRLSGEGSLKFRELGLCLFDVDWLDVFLAIVAVLRAIVALAVFAIVAGLFDVDRVGLGSLFVFRSRVTGRC